MAVAWGSAWPLHAQPWGAQGSPTPHQRHCCMGAELPMGDEGSCSSPAPSRPLRGGVGVGRLHATPRAHVQVLPAGLWGLRHCGGMAMRVSSDQPLKLQGGDQGPAWLTWQQCGNRAQPRRGSQVKALSFPRQVPWCWEDKDLAVWEHMSWRFLRAQHRCHSGTLGAELVPWWRGPVRTQTAFLAPTCQSLRPPTV